MTMHTVKRISDYATELPPGSDPIVVQLYIRSTARERHLARVAAAAASAADYCGIELPPEGAAAAPADARQRMAAALALALHGVGGPLGLGGVDGRTDRPSWARRLGSGRRHAHDGSAWTAALEGALQALACHPAPGDVADLIDTAERHGDLLWVVTYALRQALEQRHEREVATAWVDVARRAALRSTPGTDAGRVAGRHGLPTGPYRAIAVLRAETASELVAHVTGRDASEIEAEIETAPLTVEVDGLTVEATPAGRIAVGDAGDDPAVRVTLTVRSVGHPLATAAIEQAAGWTEGLADFNGVEALRAALT